MTLKTNNTNAISKTITSHQPIMTITMVIFLIILYIISLNNYLLFHITVEFFSIIIAISVFIITNKGQKYLKTNYLLVLGYAYLFIGGLDFLHTLGFKGMNIFTDYDYYANQLWIATRFFESLVLVVSILSIKFQKNINPQILFGIYLTITLLIVISIFPTDIFPVCYIEGVGQTSFKIIAEYVIVLVLLLAMLLTYFNKDYFDKEIYKYIQISISFTIASELMFTLYVDNYGILNMAGHYFKIFSFYFIYKAVLVKCIEEPYESIFKELTNMRDILGDENKQLVQKINFDGLTGIFNHRYMIDRIQNEIQRFNRTNEKFSVLFIDMDDFKSINDTYSHYHGDEVLIKTANILTTHSREIDVVGRYGGDEFIILALSSDHNSSVQLAKRLLREIEETIFYDNIKTTVSIGMKTYEGEDFEEFMELLDKSMYKAKNSGKNRLHV